MQYPQTSWCSIYLALAVSILEMKATNKRSTFQNIARTGSRYHNGPTYLPIFVLCQQDDLSDCQLLLHCSHGKDTWCRLLVYGRDS
jgi:hypothetical protein